MKDVFFDKKISVKSQAIVYADSNELRSMEYDSWAFKATHIAKFATFHHECVQWLVTVSRWDCRCEHSEARIRVKGQNVLRNEQPWRNWQ
jgi:hypothetical protein